MNDNIINISEERLKKNKGIEFYSFQQIKDLGITFPEERLSEVGIHGIKNRIENNEYLPTILLFKKQGKKITVIEGKHVVQAINEVEKQCDNWNEKVIPVRFYRNGDILD